MDGLRLILVGVVVVHCGTDDLEEIYDLLVLRNILVPRVCFQILPHQLGALPNGNTVRLIHIIAGVLYLLGMLILFDLPYIFGFLLPSFIHVDQCASAAWILFLHLQVHRIDIVWILNMIDTPGRHA